MAMVTFKKGLLSALPTTHSEGTFYVTTDERAIYLDVSDSSRIRLGDFQEFATLEALKANTNPSTTALYYISGVNVLAKWNGTEYIQINTDTGATSIEVVGEGNAVTAASYDAVTRKITLEMGETFATAAELKGLSDRVGQIPDEEAYADINTVVGYINKKAEETLAAAQGGSSETAASVKQALDTYKTENNAKVTANADAIAAIKDSENIDSFADVESAIESSVAGLNDKIGTVDEGKTVVQMIKDAQTAATYDDTQVKADIVKAQNAADAAQTDVDALETLVGTLPEGSAEGTTVMSIVNTKADSATVDGINDRVKEIEKDYLVEADKTELQGNIDTVSGKVTTLIGEDANKSVRTIANEELAAQLVAEGAKESLDTLAEIAAWIQSHPDDASAMNEAIVALQKQVQGIDAGEGTVKKYVDDAITALKIGDYALAADLTALAGRVEALENDTHTHANKTVLDGITAEKVAAWDAAEGNAIAKVNELANGAVKTNTEAIAVLNGDEEGSVNKKVADAVAAEAEIARAAEEANAAAIKAISDDYLKAEDKTELGDAITAEADRAKEAEKANADAIALKANDADVYKKTETYTKAEVEALLTWGSFEA